MLSGWPCVVRLALCCQVGLVLSGWPCVVGLALCQQVPLCFPHCQVGVMSSTDWPGVTKYHMSFVLLG